MHRRTPIACLLAGASVFILPQVFAFAYVRARHGFGEGDLPAFAIWSAFFAGVILVAAVAVGFARIPRNLPARTLVFAALGAVLGIGWTFTVACCLLGPWIGAFSFPVLYLWMGGGAIGLTLAARLTVPEPASVPHSAA